VAGGLLSLAGALANAELGAMYPRAGGDYVYLREAFHPLAGFLVGWLTFFAIYAGTVATLAAGFAAGFAELVPLGEAGALGLALTLVVVVSTLNYFGVRWGARANNLTAWIKVAALVLFTGFAFFLGRGRIEHLTPLLPDRGEIGPASAFGLALSPVLFSYLGWNACVYVASEIRAPGRTIPRALFLGLGICTAIYLLVNGAYLYGLPIESLRGVANAAEASSRALFGPVGGTVAAVLVLVSILGTLNATILVGPRIAYAMALDGLFFRGLERAHPSFATPSRAILLQAAVSVGLLLVLRSFPRALDYTTFAILLATLADVAALYRLRRKQPARPRPYRAWGYPWVPALYALGSALIAATLLAGRPRECAVGLAVLACGLPFYVGFTRRARSPAGAPPD
jgi:APA family basic amino acid/polyamine antiporter